MLTDTLMTTHCTEERSKLYIALENLNYEWKRSSILQVLDMWNAGFSLDMISQEIQRDYDEIALLIIELNDYLFSSRNRGVNLSNPLKNLSPRYYGNRSRFFENIHEEYVVFETSGDELFWDERHVITCENLWNLGYSTESIAQHVKRRELEVILLVIDRCRVGRIAPRESGLKGTDEEEVNQAI